MNVKMSLPTAILGIGIAALVSLPAMAQQSSTTTEVRQFEVVAVNGNKVVVRGQAGTQEITAPADFRMTVDGKPVTVADLKPGMRGSATITTTTTVTPVHVTEVRNGVVMRRVGNSIIVRRDDNTVHMFSEADVTTRRATLMRGGRPISITDLREGDRLTATIVTDAPPKVMTQREVDAAMTSAPAAPAAAPAARPATGASSSSRSSAGASTGAATAPAPSAPAATASSAPRQLPKTASPLPAIGLIGAASMTLGALLSLRRRRR